MKKKVCYDNEYDIDFDATYMLPMIPKDSLSNSLSVSHKVEANIELLDEAYHIKVYADGYKNLYFDDYYFSVLLESGYIVKCK